jgi:RNA polymerase sigma-70 factor (ECF subfamily)
MSREELTCQQLIDGLRSGDQSVAAAFFASYSEVLGRIAQRRLSSGLRRRVDADDIVQSVFRTFFRRAQGGEFVLSDSQKLWSLLCAITLTKVRQKAQFHRRLQRNYERESQPPPHPGQSGIGPAEPVAPGPSPSEAAEFEDQFHMVLDHLDPEERQVVELRLQDCPYEEIAHVMGISERTVRRILQRVQGRVERLL